MKPMIADAITAPARLRVRNVKRTMSAKATLERRSFVLGSLVGCVRGASDENRGFGTINESGYASGGLR